jgi:hypothetical protein
LQWRTGFPGARQSEARVEHPTKIEAAEAAHNREAMRDSLFLTATVQLMSDRSDRTVRVRNLSAGGMMADCTEALTAGEPVLVTLRGVGEVLGEIAWRRNGRIGVSFGEPIDPKQARKPVGVAESNVPQHIKQRATRRPALRSD